MPKLMNFQEQSDPHKVSETVAMDFVALIEIIVDDRLNKRLLQGDIALCFDAQVTAVSNEIVTISTITVPDAQGNDDKYSIETEITTSVSAEYDDYIYNNVVNCTGQVLSVGDWVKVCTYDNVKYYAIHMV